MKNFILPLILLLASCASTSNDPQNIELTGKLLGSFVSTSSGLLSGDILHIQDSTSIKKVSGVASGNPKKVFVIHSDPKLLNGLAGKNVKLVGEIYSDHKDAFHTDFTIKVISIEKL